MQIPMSKMREEDKMHKRDTQRIPKAVHHQCMWIVRDIDRLYRLDAIYRHGKRDDELVFYEDENCRCISYEVTKEAAEKLACIKAALKTVPEEYRIDLLDAIVDGARPTLYAHENTWKKWRRVFIAELAGRLKLI